MDYIRHTVMIFMLTILSKATSSSVNIDMCTDQTVNVDDGHHRYLTYNRSMINSGSSSGVCQCVITKNSYYKPDVDIWIQDSSICGTTCCTEQLYIRASDEKTYDSCADDEPSVYTCQFPRARSLLNVGSIYQNQQVKIMFYFSGEVIQITDSFTLDIKVENSWKWETIRIECTQPTFGDSLPSSCSTTYKSTAATTLSETRGESTDRPTTDTASQTESSQRGTPNVGLIAGVSIGCLCVIAGIIVVTVFISHRNKKASARKTPNEGTLPKIPAKEYDLVVDTTMYSSTNTSDMPSADMYIVDNPQYRSRQTPDNQLSADTYIMDNPQYGSMPTHPGPRTELIENTIYMEADMDCIDHHMDNSQQPDNDEYSEVDNVNHGSVMGSVERNTRDSAYGGGTQLFENAIYDNQTFDVGRMSDVVYSGDTKLVDNAVYG